MIDKKVFLVQSSMSGAVRTAWRVGPSERLGEWGRQNGLASGARCLDVLQAVAAIYETGGRMGSGRVSFTPRIYGRQPAASPPLEL
jgi:hypothetical protein